MTERHREEYSYFKASGKSLDAVLTVERMKSDIATVEKKLYEKYGASWAQPWPGTKLRLIFNAGSAPEGWDTSKDIGMGGNDRYEAKEPPPGSADEQRIAALQEIIDGYKGRERLELIFDCGDMPMKDLPGEKRYSDRFVIYQTVEDQNVPQGLFHSTSAICFYSNSAIKSSDPLTHLEIGGAYYIRVPNDENGAPRFTPPDAEKVEIGALLEIDRREFCKKRDAELAPRKPAP